jgi:hypothetical protein
VTDVETANHFYGEVLGFERNPNSPGEHWVEYETGNVALAVMTLHIHDYEFTPYCLERLLCASPTPPRRGEAGGGRRAGLGAGRWTPGLPVTGWLCGSAARRRALNETGNVIALARARPRPPSPSHAAGAGLKGAE